VTSSPMQNRSGARRISVLIRPRWRKVIRDLWDSKSRTILVVLSIAVGVFAVGTLSATQVILTHDLTAGFAASNPASASITTKSSATASTGLFDQDLVDTIRRMDGVRDAEGRRTVTVRLQVGSDQWRNLLLVAYPNPLEIHIGKVWPETGLWPPAKREVTLERASLPYLGLAVGDSLTVETPDNRHLQLQVAGTAHDPSRMSPVLQTQIVGYVTLDTMECLGLPRDFSELRLVVEGDGFNRAHITEVANRVRDKIENSGRSIAAVSVPVNPGRHPAADIMDSILLILGVLGFLSLFLSGFLVVNTISAMLAQQVRQIGMMKAVGARAGQVLGIYLGLVVVYGVLSLGVAVPAAAVGAFYFTKFTAGLLNLDISSPPLPVSTLLLEVAVSLVVPVVAALYPVISATRTRVYAALNDYGMGQSDFGAGLVDRAITAVSGQGWLPRPLMLSLRNTFRRKGRLALTLATLALGGATFIAVFTVQSSIQLTLGDALRYWNYDTEVSFRRNYRLAEISNVALSVPGVSKIESWGFTSARRQRPDGSESDGFLMIAPPAQTDLLRPTLLEGRWLLPEDESALVINTEVRDDEPDLHIGGQITLRIGERKSGWTIVGLARGVLAGPTIYANFPYFTQVVNTVGRAGRVQVVTNLHDTASQAEAGRSLESAFRAAGVRVSLMQTTGQQRERTTSQFQILIVFLMMMAILLAGVGGLGLAGMMGINVLERRREIGVMRAIGASDGAVALIFIAEGMTVGVISWLLGTLLAIPISRALTDSVGLAILKSPLSYEYSYLGAGLWLALAVVIAALSSLAPARSAAQLTVHDVLAYE
jgi:putative ABC transport system permease protein